MSITDIKQFTNKQPAIATFLSSHSPAEIAIAIQILELIAFPREGNKRNSLEAK